MTDGERSETGTPAFGLAGRTRHDAARDAMALVRAVLDAGGAPRDVAVVTCAPDEDEARLAAAAERYGLRTATWTQLPLTETLPYRVVTASCRVLAAETVSLGDFVAPLEYGWTAPDGGIEPIPATGASRLRSALDAAADRSGDTDATERERPVETWCALAASIETAPVVDAYRRWVRAHRDRNPTPEAVTRTLRPLVDATEESVVAERWARDASDVGGVTRSARSVVRLRDLLGEVASKYATRAEAADATPDWETVASLCESLAGLRAGRREHADASAIDVLEANDVWGVSRPLVVVVGLTDGQWLTRTESPLPRDLQTAIRAGGGGADPLPLATRAAWDTDRIVDQFHDAVTAATGALVCVRHRVDRDGVERPPSPLLDRVDARPIDGDALAALRSRRTLPSALANALDLPAAADSTEAP
ncbi:hypothetical protein MBEHAL_2170 [Halarchaeum acidiphilum MH1-52-1]|uniref:Uncharacterized protein n=1 Tax=Halarchaeum acidiphilum MH1-52-1 TaxID=1261545 RepID=U2YWK5_9EURY|nr:hypothetical protein MBEHAL_2170 [Halarchaeum acidiphilum MH1-52-1]